MTEPQVQAQQRHIVQVNSALGLMGLTGAGKTSLIATAAEYCYETFGKVTLLYSFAGGGFPTKVTSLQRLGIIRTARLRTRGECFETTMRASMGWWPSRINPTTGEVAPGVRMVPPITQRLTLRCPQGHVVKVVGFQKDLTPQACPTCKTHCTLATPGVTVERQQERTKGFEPVGQVAFDDLTSMLNWQMEDMANRHAKQEIKGEETALGGRISSGELLFGGNNRSHYGFVQLRASEMVHNSLAIPGLVLPPIWTALTLETVDEGGMNVVGMKLAGKAKTDEAGAWFGNMLEVMIEQNEDGQDVRRLCLNEFVDKQGRKHLIKHRGTPAMPAYLQDAPGMPWGNVNLGVFYRLLEEDVQKDAAAQAARFGEVPGVPDGEVSYGDGDMTPGAAATVPGPVSSTPRAPVPSAPGRRPPAAPKPRAATPAAAPAAVVETPAPAVAAPVPAEDGAGGAAAASAGSEPGQAEPAPASPVPAVAVTAAQAPVARAPAPPTPSAPPVRAVAPPGARPPIAPPPGPRPPAAAPRRPPTAVPVVPVGAKP